MLLSNNVILFALIIQWKEKEDFSGYLREKCMYLCSNLVRQLEHLERFSELWTSTFVGMSLFPAVGVQAAKILQSAHQLL
jgi:hypothetical protein